MRTKSSIRLAFVCSFGELVSKIHFLKGRIEILKRLLTMLFDLTPNAYWKIIDWQMQNKLSIASYVSNSDGETAESKVVPPVAVAVLSAFVHYYGVCTDRLPMVYSRSYVIERLMPHTITLLNVSTSK